MSQFTEKFIYEVFLSFRGEDVRSTFISHLLNALQQNGIKTFYDDDGLPRGEDIQQELYRAIESSRLSIVTFSPKYARSRWCLDELVKIMELKRSRGLIVLPVFYGVHASNVRYQSGPFKKDFEEHTSSFKHELHRVNKWKQAMKFAADLAGFPFQYKGSGSESKFIKYVVTEVLKKLNARQLSVPKYIVGGESLVDRISAWLQNGSSKAQIGILYGLGGVGKTTIAKVIYNEHFNYFEASSFLAGIRSALERENGIINLQEQLVSNISGNETVKIYNTHEGWEKIRKVIRSQKVLIVLDDVDVDKQFKAMFDDSDLFLPGSKVLITTRSKCLGKDFRASTVLFQVHPLTAEESAQLFSQHAFKESHPPQEYSEILKQFIEYCQGLPLAIEVLGSLLCNEPLEIWKSQHTKLEEFPNQTVTNVLKLSYDSLEDSNDRDIFLHIAFFMVGMKESLVLEILNGCGLHVQMGLNNVIKKGLLSVDEFSDTLVMHRLIQQMAFEIVRQEAPSDLGQRSRLVFKKNITGVMHTNMGTSKVKGLRLDHFDLYPVSIKTSAFSKMENLDVLILQNIQLDGEFADFPKKIKCMVWQGCPLQCIPSSFELNDVVLLDLQRSCLVQAWKGRKGMRCLKVLNLSYSHHLLCTPDLSTALNLECLLLEDCQSLVKMHESVGNLSKLTLLNLKGCQRLESFSIPPSVMELNVDGCSNLFKVTDEVEPLSVVSVPQRHIPARFPMSLLAIHLPFLQKLDLSDCGISRDDVLEQLSSANSLEHLNLSGNPIRMLNNGKHAFRKLKSLELTGCTELQSVSQLFPHHVVTISFCASLKRITYIFEEKYSKGQYVLQSIGGGNLTFDEIEIDKGYNDDEQETGWTRDCYRGQASILGFPDLETFDMTSSLTFSEDFAFGRIWFTVGTLQVCLPGDQIAKWFSMTATEAWMQPVYFTVPSNPLPIRAFNLGFAITTDEGDFPVFGVTIENLSIGRKWEWSYDITLFGEGTFDLGSEVTWISHLCVGKSRDVQSGDSLKISISCKIDFEKSVKWGARILYEEEEQGGGGEGGKATGNGGGGESSSLSSTGWEEQNVLSEEEEEEDAFVSWNDCTFGSEEEEEVDDAFVVSWYDRTFRSALL